MQEVDENYLYFWRIANVGRVTLIVDRVGVLLWSGRGLGRWLGRYQPRVFWFDPAIEEPPPQTLTPGDALVTAVPYMEILLSLKGTGLKRLVVIQPICEDRIRLRYHGQPERCTIGPLSVPRWQFWRRRLQVADQEKPGAADAV